MRTHAASSAAPASPPPPSARYPGAAPETTAAPPGLVDTVTTGTCADVREQAPEVLDTATLAGFGE
ncbi:hypothetical protein [Nocardia asteroides]|uniref:hypothetical protein n=1 Tax=Nocardia asteroides TaxID=1824 RepID=UPI001E286DC5|nr:hypothetical protein [Nocardia asteroides]UGT63822.1 hypothetical protein LTT61_11170 [Nocardia asteroides]